MTLPLLVRYWVNPALWYTNGIGSSSCTKIYWCLCRNKIVTILFSLELAWQAQLLLPVLPARNTPFCWPLFKQHEFNYLTYFVKFNFSFLYCFFSFTVQAFNIATRLAFPPPPHSAWNTTTNNLIRGIACEIRLIIWVYCMQKWMKTRRCSHPI